MVYNSDQTNEYEITISTEVSSQTNRNTVLESHNWEKMYLFYIYIGILYLYVKLTSEVIFKTALFETQEWLAFL